MQQKNCFHILLVTHSHAVFICMSRCQNIPMRTSLFQLIYHIKIEVERKKIILQFIVWNSVLGISLFNPGYWKLFWCFKNKKMLSLSVNNFQWIFEDHFKAGAVAIHCNLILIPLHSKWSSFMILLLSCFISSTILQGVSNVYFALILKYYFWLFPFFFQCRSVP